MHTLYEINLWIHIVAGAISLLTVVIPLVVKKGGLTHRRVGWVFTVGMAVVAVTGLWLAASWLIAPTVVKPLGPDATPEMIARRARSLRAAAPFFGMLSFMTAYAVWGGIMSLRKTASRIAPGVLLALIALSGVVVLSVGLRYQQPVFIVFGAVAGGAAVRDLWKLREPRPTGREKVIVHLKAMLGGATAAATAFSVQVASRLTDSGILKIAVWITPMVLGFTVAAVFARMLRARKASADA